MALSTTPGRGGHPRGYALVQPFAPAEALLNSRMTGKEIHVDIVEPRSSDPVPFTLDRANGECLVFNARSRRMKTSAANRATEFPVTLASERTGGRWV